jgi:hypothetical protein
MEPYKNLGYKTLTDGTELFGNDQNIAPQAWLQQIYPPLTKTEIAEIEDLVRNILPISLVNFYGEMNGFSVFIRKISIYGLRKDFSSKIESSWQPFSIETENLQERPKNAKKEYIFIGSFSESGNSVYMDTKNEKVSVCGNDNADPIITYENLFHFILEELTDIFSINDRKYLRSI